MIFFTESSSTFTVPRGVHKIDVFCVGGGGASTSFSVWAGGGGGGYTSTVLGASVTPGDTIPVVVGAGQINSSNFGTEGAIAPSSSIGSICSAAGGFSAYGSASRRFGGSGGSGGGTYGGNGGSDGSSTIDSFGGGKGQGTTTRYFGESTGTLYAGGGGAGGNHTYNVVHISGTDCTLDDLKNKADKLYHLGGAGGGGNGDLYIEATIWSGGNSATNKVRVRTYENGAVNTGGGGGGNGGSGGSGICIIRWGK